jgi:hypothetical protein
MPNCKTCGTNFHACSSCGLTDMYEYEYCCFSCFTNSAEYKIRAGRINALVETLNDAQCIILRALLDEYDSFYETYCIKLLNEKLEDK